MPEFVYRGLFWNNYYKINFPCGTCYSLLGAPFAVDLKHTFKGGEVVGQYLSTVRSKFAEIGS